MNQFVRVTGAALLIAVLLAASGYAPAQPVRAHAYQAGTNCAVSPFMLFGQRSTIVKIGTSGGAVDSVSDDARSDHLWFENVAYNVVKYQYQPVRILVLDDFSYYDANAGFNYPTNTSHGFFVLALLNNWYRQIFTDQTGEPFTDETLAHMVARADAGTPYGVPIVQIMPIDYSAQGYDGFNFELDRSFETGYLSDQLVELIRSTGWGRVILNMSFVMLECSGLDMMAFQVIHRSNPDYTLVDYLGWDEVKRRLESVDYASDPLAKLLDQLTRGEFPMSAQPSRIVLAGNPVRQMFNIVIPVAASGNYGPGSGPYAPAGWPNVIGVSAGQGNNPYDLWKDSTPGEITVPGAYFPLFDKDNCVGGTSFAAPGVSLLLAFDLSKNVPACQNEQGIPALASEYEDNLAFPDAYAKYCEN